MNNAELENKIEVMQHFLNGGEIEFALIGGTNWSKASMPIWDWSKFVYRIKEEEVKYPIYAKRKNVQGIFIVKFTAEKTGEVIEDTSGEYSIGCSATNWIPVYNDAVWEVLPDYEELTLYYEVIDTELGRYEVIGTLHTEEELKYFPEYVKTGRSFKLPRKGK
jgi:hypothetical protein